MMHYRIYELNASGQIVHGEDALCRDDAEAFEFAGAFAEIGRPAEVWQGSRFVARLDPAEQVK